MFLVVLPIVRCCLICLPVCAVLYRIHRCMGGATIGAGGDISPHFFVTWGQGGGQDCVCVICVMFLLLPEITSSADLNLEKCRQVLKTMIPEVRAMFPNVESLIRLLLVNPASSATAERSFSGLRRLKTYLRSTCGQLRLNNLAICHVHKEILDTVDMHQLMKEFILANDTRASVFGYMPTAVN